MSALRNAAWRISRACARRRGRFSDAMYQLANIYVRAYKNLDYDMKTNGEVYVLRRLAEQGARVIFDVGANDGEYARACLCHVPKAEVHSFEIVPATFERLHSNLGREQRAVLNDFGLSDEEADVDVNYNPDHDGTSSLIDAPGIHAGAWETVKGRVITGDAYRASRNIAEIDLLKIDVEGAEDRVLKGFTRSLEENRVTAIQFEFGMANIYSKFLLIDYWKLLTDYGFVLGPIMPAGVDFRPYDPRHEDFQGALNFLAVHAGKPAIVDALRFRRSHR